MLVSKYRTLYFSILIFSNLLVDHVQSFIQSRAATVKQPLMFPTASNVAKHKTKRLNHLGMLAIFNNSEEPMTTRHLKLEQIFCRTRDYLFSITKNVRFYEWTQEEVETLYSDLVESMSQDPKSTYELNQFIALRDSREMWEVADGQQRLITLCLLYAALRDALGDPNHRMAMEIQDSLVVQSYGHDTAFRVALRQKHNDILQDILEGKDIPLKKAGRNPVQSLLAKNYWLLRNAIESDADVAEREHGNRSKFLDKLYVYLNQRVYIYLTIPESQSVARKLIGVSRRGKDTEPLDEFKSMVVFLGIQRESEQDEVLEKWVALQDRLGRNTFEDACMLMAQAELQKRVKRDGAVDLMEEFWKTFPERDGRQFFEQVLSPGVGLLHQFRNGESIDRSNVEISMKWAFLRLITRNKKSTAGSLEIAVLCALRYIDTNTNPDYLEHVLSVLERVGLFFATTSVKVIPRHQRIFGICKAIRSNDYIDKYDLSLGESLEVMEALDTVDFGATSQKRKIAAAILGRTDAALASQSSDAYIDGSFTVEHVLPQNPSPDSSWSKDWSTDGINEWQHRLGNLCLLNQRKNSAASNNDFSEKKTLYKQTIFPVTLRICKFDQWLQPELEKQHKWMLHHCQSYFGLKTVGDPARLLK